MIKIICLLLTLCLSARAATGFKKIVDFSGSNEIQLSNAVVSTTLGSVVWVPSGTWVLTNNYTLPAGKSLWMDAGAIISVNSGKTFTINGSIQGDYSQKFAGAGTTVFGQGALTGMAVPVTWWGADNNNSGSDQVPAILAALNGVASGGGQELFVPGGNYTLKSQLTIPSAVNRLKLKGNSFSKAVFNYTPPNTGTNICIDLPAGYDRFEMEGIGLTAVAVTGKRSIGLQVEGNTSTELYLTDVNFSGWNKWGINVVSGLAYGHLERCRFELIANSSANGGDAADYAVAINTPLTGSFLAMFTVSATRFCYCDAVLWGKTWETVLRDCSIENCGSNGRTTPGHLIDVATGTVGLDNCFFESNITPGGTTHLARFNGTSGVLIARCEVSNEHGSYTTSNRDFYFDSNCHGNVIIGTEFIGDSSVNWVLVGGTCSPVQLIGCGFVDNYGAQITALSSIQAHLTYSLCDITTPYERWVSTPVTGELVRSKIVTANATLGHYDGSTYIGTSGVVVTIPDASTEPDRIRTLKLTVAGTASVRAASIDGATNYTLSAVGKFLTVHAVGTNWWVIGSN